MHNNRQRVGGGRGACTVQLILKEDTEEISCSISAPKIEQLLDSFGIFSKRGCMYCKLSLLVNVFIKV